MIKVNYNPETTLVKGYYPDSINYTSIPEPYIEITEEQHQEGLGKIMCVLNGVYQEYLKPDNVILAELKITRIQETKTKRDTFLSLNINVSTGEYKATQTAKSLFFNAVNGRTSTQFPMEWRLA